MQARAKMILSQGEEEASRRLVDAGNFFCDEHTDRDGDIDAIEDENGARDPVILWSWLLRITVITSGKGSTPVSIHLSYLQAVSKVT